jgi:hypothetical protein
MSLSSLWQKSPEQFRGKNIRAIVGWAGSGELLDDNEASKDFRKFLKTVPSDNVVRYCTELLQTTKFKEAPSALQDIINEVGRRSGFEVEHGLYRGKPTAIGFDGIWRTEDGHSIVLEVKTSDTYAFDLDVIAEYRRRLAADNEIKQEKSSILIVVGRAETGALETQIRGSPHAWDIRLISVAALLRLMEVKEKLEDPSVVRKIRDILTPKEFTRVDEIIDLVFSTAEEAKQEEEIESDVIALKLEKAKATPVDFRDKARLKIQADVRFPLIKRSPAIYSSPDNESAICCLISKAYPEKLSVYFWFGFRRSQREGLHNYPSAQIAFCCGSEKTIALIPLKTFEEWLPKLHVTDQGRSYYWHVHLAAQSGKILLETKAGQKNVDLTPYLLAE